MLQLSLNFKVEVLFKNLGTQETIRLLETEIAQMLVPQSLD